MIAGCRGKFCDISSKGTSLGFDEKQMLSLLTTDLSFFLRRRFPESPLLTETMNFGVMAGLRLANNDGLAAGEPGVSGDGLRKTV